MNITKASFGKVDDTVNVEIFTLTNNNGMEVRITNYGGIIQSLKAPDKQCSFEDVVLGFDNIEGYLNESPYFGAIVGRYGNRINDGKFILDGIDYELAINNGKNHLHGGEKGFDKVIWNATGINENNYVALKLEYLSHDGEEGYPGNLNVVVTYTLSDDNSLRIDYRATTDKRTVLNLTNHSYFNLTANPRKKILDHTIWLNSDYYVPIDSTSIPIGKLERVKGTPFDFKRGEKIESFINSENIQLENGQGYDHCFVFNDYKKELKLQASAYEENTGRFLEVFTDQPGIQFYTGNFLDGSNIGKGNIPYEYRTGFCLETQHFPDSPNQPNYPSTELNPGEVYSTTTTYKFSVK